REIRAVEQYNPPKEWFYNEEFGNTKETEEKSEETAYMAVEMHTTMATMVDVQNPIDSKAIIYREDRMDSQQRHQEGYTGQPKNQL
ncbi:hypothetical protein VNI00_017787, partial [Paramarasmius palmivorus]